MIDRIGPMQRPARRAAGFQKWLKLLFLHWQVPVEDLRPLIPAELSIDTYDGAAFVGVVPFVMRDVRPSWWPEAAAFNFLETNVRTYVHLDGQPGVYFMSLEANSRLAVSAARVGWGLPYYLARMNFRQDGNEISYDSARRSGSGPRHATKYRIGEMLGASQPETLEFFLLERYLMFVNRKGRIDVGHVHHTPYLARQVELLELHDELVQASGLAQPSELPFCTHYVEGVNAEIFALKPFNKPLG